MDRFEADVMEDLLEDGAEGPARSAYDEGDEFDEYDELEGAEDEAEDELLGRVGQVAGGLLGAEDEFDEGFDEMEAEGLDEFDSDSLDDAVADALEEEDADAFFRRLRRIAGRVGRVARRVGRGVGQVARVVAPIASAIPIPQAQAIGRIAGVAGRLLADGADEFEAIDELVESFDDNAIDAAAPVIAGLTLRRVMPGVSRLPRQTRRRLVHGVAQATRTLVRRQGAPAARGAARIATNVQRAVRRRRLPARAAGPAIARAAQRVARNPRAAQRLARPLTTTATRGVATAARPARVGVVTRGGRSFRLRGPVTVTITGG